MNLLVYFWRKYSSVYYYVLVGCAIYLLLLLLNYVTPFMADDYNLTHYKGGGIFTRLNNAVIYTKWMYLNQGGSLFSAFLQGFFLNGNKMLFNVFNALIFIHIVHLLNNLIGLKNNIYSFCIIFSLLLMTAPNIGQDYLWVVGSCAYLWPVYLSIIYIYLYNCFEKRQRVSFLLLLIPISFLIGNSHGGIALIVLMIPCFEIAKSIISKNSIKKSVIFLLSSALMGFIAVIFAPGNIKRINNSVDGAKSIMQIITHQFFNVGIPFAWLIIIVVLSIFYCNRRSLTGNSINYIRMFNPSTTYGLIALVAFGVHLVLPAANRSLLFFPSLALLSFGYFFKKNKALLSDSVKFLFSCVLIVAGLSVYVVTLKNAIRVNQLIKAREEIIFSEIDNGKKILDLPRYDHLVHWKEFSGLQDINSNSCSWQNKGVTKFYGLEKIEGYYDTSHE